MEAQRSNFVPGLVLGVGIGLILGHVTFWRQPAGLTASPPRHAPLRVNYSDLSPAAKRIALDATDASFGDLFDQVNDFSATQPLVNAIAVDTNPAVAETRSKHLIPVSQPVPHEEPQPLPFGGAVAPLTGNTAAEMKTIRELIELEMPHFTEDQRQVWFDSLKDVKKEDVAGILKMWKLIGGPVGGVSSGGPPSMNSPQPYFNSDMPSPFDAAPRTESPQLVAARKISRQNLLMSQTPGYVPLVLDANQPLAADGQSPVGWPDFSRVRLQETPHILDLAIEGPGFLRLRDAAGKYYFSKGGRFTLDAEGRIALPLGEDLYTLVPEVTVGELNPDLESLVILQSGDVVIEQPGKPREQRSNRNVGKILTTSLLSSRSLVSCGNGLFEDRGDQRHSPYNIGDWVKVRSMALWMPEVDLGKEEKTLKRIYEAFQVQP